MYVVATREVSTKDALVVPYDWCITHEVISSLDVSKIGIRLSFNSLLVSYSLAVVFIIEAVEKLTGEIN
jgi:hypothetical protein